MLALDVSEFAVEFTDGSISNVGATNKRATAKLFEVTDAEARTYGTDRVKLVFEDASGNEVQVALTESGAGELADGIESVREEGAGTD